MCWYCIMITLLSVLKTFFFSSFSYSIFENRIDQWTEFHMNRRFINYSAYGTCHIFPFHFTYLVSVDESKCCWVFCIFHLMSIGVSPCTLHCTCTCLPLATDICLFFVVKWAGTKNINVCVSWNRTKQKQKNKKRKSQIELHAQKMIIHSVSSLYFENSFICFFSRFCCNFGTFLINIFMVRNRKDKMVSLPYP